ncbi:hypothetical protein [Nioella aestuarii]|uniref:hypothetical protein n=1 Tax=Nioella aestuarii TaxID=1662864 RepID=UPI003D7FECF1
MPPTVPTSLRVLTCVVRVTSANDLLPALQAAVDSGKPTVLDVAMINNPPPTTGHWNIPDIYSPDKDVSHVSA